MSTHQATRWPQFITPLGGNIALICFFFPWVNIGTNISGLTVALGSPHIATAFIACLLIICSSLYAVIRGTPWKSRVLILVSSPIVLGALWSEYLSYTRLTEEMGEKFQSTLGFGAWGALVGFAVATVGVFLVRREKTDDPVVAEYPRVLVHSGGIIALSCFFMPWEGIGAGSSFTGFERAKHHPLIAIALIASITVVGVSFYTRARGLLWKSREPVLVSAGVGLGTLLVYYVNYFNMINSVNKRGLEISANTLEFGLWGTVIGFTIAAIGMFLTIRKRTEKQVEIPAESG